MINQCSEFASLHSEKIKIIDLFLLNIDRINWVVCLVKRAQSTFLNNSMKLAKVVELVEAKIVAGVPDGKEVDKAFCSDLMSDVLTIDTDKMLLVTGMTNIQIVRTAEMADIQVILLVRNKQMTSEVLKLAAENRMVILQSPFSMFRAAGVLYEAGLKPVY